MDWTAYLDAYCERTMPGLLAEPLNAITNAAFWLAAWWVWRTSARRGWALSADLHAMLGLLAFIGAASLAFHTFAQRWAAALDVLAIALYLHVYLALHLRHGLGLGWRWAWLGVPLFAVLSAALALLWRSVLPPALAAPAGYLGAWSVLVLLLAEARVLGRPAAPWLLAASLVFVASLTLRQLDLPLCVQWRWGTHFMWHLLNAVVLGCTSWAMVLTAQARRLRPAAVAPLQQNQDGS